MKKLPSEDHHQKQCPCMRMHICIHNINISILSSIALLASGRLTAGLQGPPKSDCISQWSAAAFFLYIPLF